MVTPDDYAAVHADARNRSARSLLQGAAAVALFAAVEVLRAALDAGGAVDVGQIARDAALAAVIAVAAWLHRIVLDPSRVPSLPPPGDDPAG